MAGSNHLRWAAVVAVGGLAGLVGCGKSDEPKVAKVEPAGLVSQPSTPAIEPPPPAPAEPKPQEPPADPVGGPKPALPGQGGTPKEFVEPNSPIFKPGPPPAKPDAPLGGLNPMTDPPAGNQPPPAPPPPMPPAGGPGKPADPPPANPQANPPANPPADPNKPGNPPPEPPKPAKPDKPQEFPKEIEGKDLKWYLNQTLPTVQPDPQYREAAVRVIPAFGPDARQPAIKPLTDLLVAETDPGVQVAAITIISNMGFDVREQVKPAIRALVNVLGRTEKGSALRMYAVRSISSFGPDAVQAVASLRSIANDPSWETRSAIAEALGSIGGPAPPKKPGDEPGDPSELAALTLLNYSMTDSCMAVRMEAVKSLLAIGPPKGKTPAEYITKVKPYLESLEKRLDREKRKDGDKGVYVWLLLLQIMYDDRTEPENIKKIAGFIETPDGKNAALIRLYAIQSLGVLGPRAKDAVPKIIPALSYPEVPLQLTAMIALGRIGNEARAAVPKLDEIKKMPLEARPKDAPADWKAPPDWKPDDTLQKTAAETIDYITGKKKIADAKPDDKKDDKKPGEKK